MRTFCGGDVSEMNRIMTSLLTVAAFLQILAVAADERPPRIESLNTWGTKGKGDGEFNAPIGIAINAKDELYVTEFRNNRVQKFDAAGKFLTKFDVEPMPGGIAVSPHGEIFVAPMMLHKICVYDDTGKLLRTWGKQGTDDGEFDQPGGIAVAPDGTIYVADQVNRRIQHFTPEGKFLGKWGEYGTAAGQFDGIENVKNRTGGPNFVAVDKEGSVFTTEARPGRIQKFTGDGKPLFAFGNNTTDPGGFGGRPKNLPGPIAILVDPNDRLWISSTNNRVQLFSSAGKYLGGFESLTPGSEVGQFHTPHGVVLDSKGNLFVVDTQNHRIQRFSVK